MNALERNMDSTTYLKKLISDIKDLPKNFMDLSVAEQHELMVQKIREHCTDLPDFTIDLIPPSFRRIRCDESIYNKPKWLNMEKFLRGQKFARDNLSGVFYGQVCSLCLLFSHGPGLKTMIVTRKSDTPYLAFKRYLSTALRLRNWYTEDPWTKGTAAYEDIRAVQRMHMSVDKKVRELSKDQLDEATRIRDICCPFWSAITSDMILTSQLSGQGYCPLKILDDFHDDLKPINQHDMFATQFGFVALVILFPRDFGIHCATREDLEDFCHVWRCLGHLLGIDDEYNICRGSFEEVMQRCKQYLELCLIPNLRLVTPEWEHMMTCTFKGIHYYMPGLTFAGSFLYLTELLNIRSEHLRASLSFAIWIKYYIAKWLFRYATRWSSIRRLLNRCLNNALDRAMNFTYEEHNELKKKSMTTISRLSSSFST